MPIRVCLRVLLSPRSFNYFWYHSPPPPCLLLEQRVREASGEKASWDRVLLELAGPRLGGLPGPPAWVGRLPGTPRLGSGRPQAAWHLAPQSHLA